MKAWPLERHKICNLLYFLDDPTLVAPQATAVLYEQGGLNHDMSFALTGVAFYSIENPETKVKTVLEVGLCSGASLLNCDEQVCPVREKGTAGCSTVVLRSRGPIEWSE